MNPDHLYVFGSESVFVPHDMYEYLKLEAARLKVSEEEIYRREMAAQEEIKGNTPTASEWRDIAARSKPPAEYFEGDEECPF